MAISWRWVVRSDSRSLTTAASTEVSTDGIRVTDTHVGARRVRWSPPGGRIGRHDLHRRVATPRHRHLRQSWYRTTSRCSRRSSGKHSTTPTSTNADQPATGARDHDDISAAGRRSPSTSAGCRPANPSGATTPPTSAAPLDERRSQSGWTPAEPTRSRTTPVDVAASRRPKALQDLRCTAAAGPACCSTSRRSPNVRPRSQIPHRLSPSQPKAARSLATSSNVHGKLGLPSTVTPYIHSSTSVVPSPLAFRIRSTLPQTSSRPRQ